MIKQTQKYLLLIPFFSIFLFSKIEARQIIPSLEVLIDSAVYYVYNDHNTSLRYTNKILSEAKGKYKYYEAIGYRFQGFYFYRNSQFDSSYFYLSKAEELALELNNDSLLLDIYWTQSNTYLDNFDYYLALETTEKMKLLAQNLGRMQTELGSIHQLGRIYLSCHLYDDALKYFELCRPPENSRNSEFQRHQWWFLRMGELHVEKQEYSLAEKYLREALIRAQIHENKILKGQSYSLLASIYKERKSIECVEYYQKAIEFFYSLEEKAELVRAFTGLAEYYENQGEQKMAAKYYNLAFHKGIDADLEDKLIPALDFFLDYPKLQHPTIVPINDLIVLRIQASKKANEKANTSTLKIAEAKEKAKEAQINETIDLQKAGLLSKIVILISILISSIIIFLYFLFRKNQELKDSKEKIDQQYALIKEQSEKLQLANKKLMDNNSLLEKDLSFNSLELGHSKKLIQDIQKAANGKEEKNIKTILRTQVNNSYFEEIKYVHQFIDQQFINKLSSEYPSLSFKETELCCLLKQGLSSKEIARITLKSIPSIKVARSRIRKKLNIPKSSDISLFLNNLEVYYKTPEQ